MTEQALPRGKTVNAKAVAKYALLPGVLPRLGRLAYHFSKFMFAFSQLFGAIGLIDRHHSCLQPENIGVYRFRDVAALAASNIVWDRKNIPQIFMFFAVILSFLMVFTVLALFVINLFLSVGTAQAQFFNTPTEFGYTKDKDWALQFLTRVFGTQDLFAQTGGFNPVFGGLLLSMLRHYSMAMLVIAALMVMYLMLMTLTEAARTGKPFGTRFDSIWAPIRMALAIGLLIPISSMGFNGAQLIVLQSAKWGSNLASNVWFAGLQQIADPKENGPNYFSAAMSDPGYRFIRDILLVNLCVQTLNAQKKNNNLENQGFVKYFTSVDKEFITISVGPQKAPDFCGEIKILNVPAPNALDSQMPGGGPAWPRYTTMQFMEIAKQFIPASIEQITNDGMNAEPPRDADMRDLVLQISDRMARADNKQSFIEIADEILADSGGQKILGWVRKYWEPLGRKGESKVFFSSGETQEKLKDYNTWIMKSLQNDAQYGWTTAGVFYLRFSAVMSDIGRIISNAPRVTILPSNLTKVYADPDNARANTETIREKCGKLWGRFGAWIRNSDECARVKYALVVNDVLQGAVSWFIDVPKRDPNIYAELDGEVFDRNLQIGDRSSPVNPSISYVLRPVFNTLMSMVQIDENELHPLGVVLRWGFILFQVSVLAMGLGIFLPGAAGSIILTIGTVLFIPGVLLAFWIPMLPFLYFTFAVIEWMFSVLEAVIGMPLWALSLITLEGEGLGKGMQGVKMIFEIVLRPTIIVMALITSVIVFSAGVSFFTQAINLYAQGYDSGVSGNNSMVSNAAVGIGMVFVYMFVIYSLANSSFKLIDAIPDNFGRWGGLPKGFGGNIRVGLSETQKLLMGAAVVGGAAKFVNDQRGKVQGARKKEKDEKKQEKKDNALNARLSNIESRLP